MSNNKFTGINRFTGINEGNESNGSQSSQSTIGLAERFNVENSSGENNGPLNLNGFNKAMANSGWNVAKKM